ncbi:GDPD-domain-containing protein [Ramicandelaber brevisporus]|nr:GDPD-domain-containing protein [Ramicandelaber brevisporus]
MQLKLHFVRNDDGQSCCPVLRTPLTSSVYVRSTGIVYSDLAIKRLVVEPNYWRDLATGLSISEVDLVPIPTNTIATFQTSPEASLNLLGYPTVNMRFANSDEPLLLSPRAAVDLHAGGFVQPSLSPDHHKQFIAACVNHNQLDYFSSRPDAETLFQALVQASSTGNVDVARKLLSLGANPTAIGDRDGLNAVQHAVPHGHIQLAGELLQIGQITRETLPALIQKLQQQIEASQGLDAFKSLSLSSPGKPLPPFSAPISSPHLILTLGSNEARSRIAFARLNSGEAGRPVHPLEVSIFKNGCESSRHGLAYAVDDELVLEPAMRVPVTTVIPITSSDGLKTVELTLAFWSSGEMFAFATIQVPLVSDSRSALHPSHGGVTRITASLLNPRNPLQSVGTMSLEYWIARPFLHSGNTAGTRQSGPLFNADGTPLVVGHRGLGMNRDTKDGSRLQLGENTVLSFDTAAQAGADLVEFDVQVTRDGVPIIYHDWDVTETGVGAHVGSIDSADFLSLIPPAAASSGLRRSRSFSKLPSFDNQRTDYGADNGWNEPSDRAPPKRIKGNNPNTVRSPFVTLSDAFKRVNPTIGFNIEVKYPMGDEADDAKMLSLSELDRFVDRILEVVFDATVSSGRRVVFSSFHADICIALQAKQATFPVMFLTDGGFSKMADRRANSLTSAIELCLFADLAGIVSVDLAVLASPSTVAMAKSLGLRVATYGPTNRDALSAIAQRRIGVDVIITDEVPVIRQAFTPK